VRSMSCLWSGIAALALPVAVAMPGAGGPVLVVGAPGAGPASVAGIVAQAEGALLRSTALPWIVLARSDAGDFGARLRRAGAWLVLDGAALAGCPGRGGAERIRQD
jgi:hypothetical protein